MKKKLLYGLAITFSVFCSAVLFAGCLFGSSPNKIDHWFKDYKKSFTAYNDETDNINEAGTYWTMTMKKSCKITISISVDVDIYSRLIFTVDGKEVTTDPNTGIFTCVYSNLDLKSGNKLVFHAKWENRARTDNEGFKTFAFLINDGSGNYDIPDLVDVKPETVPIG